MLGLAPLAFQPLGWLPEPPYIPVTAQVIGGGSFANVKSGGSFSRARSGANFGSRRLGLRVSNV